MIFHRPIRPTVEHVEQYKISTLALHNYLLLSNNAIYTPSGLVDSESGDRSIPLGGGATKTLLKVSIT